jgi:hypothetical protein
MVNRGCFPEVKWPGREAYYHHIVLGLKYTFILRIGTTLGLLSVALYSVGE